MWGKKRLLMRATNNTISIIAFYAIWRTASQAYKLQILQIQSSTSFEWAGKQVLEFIRIIQAIAELHIFPVINKQHSRTRTHTDIQQYNWNANPHYNALTEFNKINVFCIQSSQCTIELARGFSMPDKYANTMGIPFKFFHLFVGIGVVGAVVDIVIRRMRMLSRIPFSKLESSTCLCGTPFLLFIWNWYW